MEAKATEQVVGSEDTKQQPGGSKSRRRGKQHSNRRDNFIWKLGISYTETGAIIGKRGSKLARIQQDTDTQIRVSQPGEYFPGTMDRVVLIEGTSLGLSAAASEILSLLRAVRTSVSCFIDDRLVLLLWLLIFSIPCFISHGSSCLSGVRVQGICLPQVASTSFDASFQ